ncbi:MAG: PorV/PorQ family protein [Balneola sp.]
MKSLTSALLFILCFSATGSAQSSLAKYGNDFLSTGAGARALGMGSANASITNDVTAGYWNVAGLSHINEPQVVYMHSERFDGIVGYDYGALALPLQSKDAVFAISFFRQGVDNIANTLNAWDADRNQPRENPQDYITRFSAADLALFFSFAKQSSETFSYGVSAKIINQRLGPFAEAWGYSLDVGAQLSTNLADFGISVRDVTTMQKMWDVNENEFTGFQEVFDDSIPSGQNEYVLPSVKLGISKKLTFSDFDLITAIDTDLLFENRQAYYINIGSMSIEPHVGAELTFKDVISFRTGVTDFITDLEGGFSVSPTLGLGLQFLKFNLDYGFASFAGTSSNLGYTHRISLQYSFLKN